MYGLEALPADQLAMKALPADLLMMEALPADQLTMEALPADQLAMETLPADQLTMVTLPADQLPLSQIFYTVFLLKGGGQHREIVECMGNRCTTTTALECGHWSEVVLHGNLIVKGKVVQHFPTSCH